jgi:hypothetical protein
MEGNLTAAEATEATAKKAKPARRRKEYDFFIKGGWDLLRDLKVWESFDCSARDD